MIRGRQETLDLVLRYEANAALPVRRRVVKDIVHLEAIRVVISELVQLCTQKDILDVDVRIDQRQLRAVQRVLERRANDLKHGRYTRPTSNHSEFTRQRRVVFELALWSPDANFVAYLQQGDIPGDISFFVGLLCQSARLLDDSRNAYSVNLP